VPLHGANGGLPRFRQQTPARRLVARTARAPGRLVREYPANVTELVTLDGRAQSNISGSLQLLAKHRLIRLVREGREIRPEAIAKTVSVDLVSGSYETTPISKVAAG
jgi:predicted transcriptional regulator